MDELSSTSTNGIPTQPNQPSSGDMELVQGSLLASGEEQVDPRADIDNLENTPAEGEESITDPWDPTKSKFDTRTMTVDLLITRIKEGEVDMAPEFQRGANLWSPVQKSRLIESLLVRIPLPAFYFDATDESRWLVVDGLQRLTVFREFVLSGMQLQNLEFLTQYDGRRFRDLPRDLRRRIQETQVTVHLIQPGTQPEVKFHIFRRINTGGLVLTAQEIRHALNQGPATKLLAELAASPAFLDATGRSVKRERMADRELVLRFLAFVVAPYSSYQVPDIDSFLNKQMAELNRLAPDQLEDLRVKFRRAMTAAHTVFRRHTFRKQYSLNQTRSPVNKALFEAWSVNLARLSDEQLTKVLADRDLVVEKAMRLLKDDHDFERAVSVGTQDVSKVKKRFRAVEELLDVVLKDKADAARD